MITNNNNIQEYNWDDIARENQKLPEGNWFLWMILAGRGFGKTRTGAETVMKLVESGEYKNIAIIGKNLHEARGIMVEGSSGLMSTFLSTSCYMTYYPSKRQITWKNGAKATIIGADNYESMRGYQFDLIWVDEFAKFKKTKDVWDQILFTLRLGKNPRCIMTTTPKPLQVLIELSMNVFTHLTRGSTFENSENLSARFVETMKATYVNTTIGKQELFGEIVINNDNCLWKNENIQYKEVDRNSLRRVVIGVDPAVTSNENSDETGIIVAGLGNDDKIYVLDDLSGKYKPNEWAKVISKAYIDYGANRVVAEVNNGGDLVEGMLRNISKYIPYSYVRAIRGKTARAEPVALLYESSNAFHTKKFEFLEKQMLSMLHDTDEEGGGGSENQHDDRVDALVWAVTELTTRKCITPSVTCL
ncbi:MAG: terminase family protein [Holosporales bacterium]|jgi:predicted phage terminase large subunit-like protein|nr:terminase family protein [Holosporales bacterium]